MSLHPNSRALALVWDDLYECDDDSDLDGAFLQRQEYFNLFVQTCPNFDDAVTIEESKL